MSLSPAVVKKQDNPPLTDNDALQPSRVMRAIHSDFRNRFAQHLDKIVCGKVNAHWRSIAVRRNVDNRNTRRRIRKTGNLTVSEIRSGSRHWRACLARQIAWHILYTSPQYGEFYASTRLAEIYTRDHSTVMSGINKIQNIITRRKHYPEAQIYSEAKAEFNASLEMRKKLMEAM